MLELFLVIAGAVVLGVVAAAFVVAWLQDRGVLALWRPSGVEGPYVHANNGSYAALRDVVAQQHVQTLITPESEVRGTLDFLELDRWIQTLSMERSNYQMWYFGMCLAAWIGSPVLVWLAARVFQGDHPQRFGQSGFLLLIACAFWAFWFILRYETARRTRELEALRARRAAARGVAP